MTSKLTTNLNNAATKLGRDLKFEHFDLGLGQLVLDDFQSMKISGYQYFNHFGNPEDATPKLVQYFESLGNDSALSEKLTIHVTTLCQDALKALNKEAAWITLRSSQNTNSHDIPRWHIDGTFWQNDPDKQRKVAIGLKGPKTLFNDLSNDNAKIDELCEELMQANDTFCPQFRKKIARLFDDARTSSAAQGQGTIFNVGAKYHAAPHSEPPIHEDRLFLSIVPGTVQQIQELRLEWNM
ncbi:MAG: hypothetical protein KTR28_02890 [Micavibrio sp.]|nr:hypothetical protein [Micavibrio sp.]